MVGDKPRVVPMEFYWADETDRYYCVHGEKLRWTCDHCKEFYEQNPYYLRNAFTITPE